MFDTDTTWTRHEKFVWAIDLTDMPIANQLYLARTCETTGTQ